MNRLISLAVIFLLLWCPHAALAKDLEIIQTHEVTAGEVLFLKLPGNPDQGYKWRMKNDLSTGLENVSVDQIGWLMAPKVKSMFFQQSSVLNVSVKAARAGQSDLAFEYFRTLGGRTISRISIVRVIIKPKLASQ